MRTLHVAAMPFPSPQGTQALVHAMLSALAEAGEDASLLTYGYGAFAIDAPYAHYRAQRFGQAGSLRSGPSLAKLGHDMALAHRLHERVRAMRPDLVVAHHVEAAALALFTCTLPIVYVAHTSLRTELPAYGFPAALARLGSRCERALCRRADRTLAVSPLLAQMLRETSGVAVTALDLPWSVPPAVTRDERADARAALGLSGKVQVLLYAGNLDGYQGLDTLVQALGRLAATGFDFVWLVATASDTRALESRLVRAGVRERVRFVPLAGEPARRTVHAASDLVLVPRASPGGIPIKLLDALARGVPVAAAHRAAAGLPLSALCYQVRDDDAHDWARVIAHVFRGPTEARASLAARAREHVARLHDPSRFVASFSEAVRGLFE